MGRTEGRGPHDTKRLILEAAATAVVDQGLAATLDDIAARAGLSKGGLVYHYRSKQALLVALGEHLIDTFRRQVYARLDPTDTTSGRLARAYINATFEHSADAQTMRDDAKLAAHLMSEPALQAQAQDDADRWRRELDADGLPPTAVHVLVACADGVVSAPLWGSVLTSAAITDLKQTLINLTHHPAQPLRTTPTR